MQKDYFKMSTARLQRIMERYRQRLLQVDNWTPKAKGLYARFMRCLHILYDRQKSGNLSTYEKILNNKKVEDSVRVKVTPPWKLKQNDNGKKTATPNLETKRSVGKRHQADRKKL